MDLFNVYKRWDIEPVRGSGSKLWDAAGLDTIPVSHAPIMIDGSYFIFEHRMGSFYRAHEESNATEAMEAVVDYIEAMAKGKPPKTKKQNHKQ